MNKRYLFFIVLFSAILVTSSVSASLFSDFWGKITGKVSEEQLTGVQFPSQAPTLNVQTEKQQQSCCFCAYDTNHTDSSKFLEVCEKFFAGKAHPVNKNIRCDVKETIPLAQKETLIPELLREHRCKKPLYLYHAEHGPVCKNIVDLVKVCVSNAPTCDIDVASISCQSFRDEEEVKGYLKELQPTLDPETTIKFCGNRLSGFFDDPACSLVDTYIVTRKSIVLEHGPCQKEGGLCRPFNESAANACINADGQLTTQRCCRNATSLQSYTAIDSIFFPNAWKTDGVHAAEGAECPLAPCAKEGEQCAVAGESYGCTLPDGSETYQSCCSLTTAGFLGKFSKPGMSCPLPSCVKEGGTLCEEGDKRMTCLDNKGKEKSQICCGKIMSKMDKQLDKIRVGFLSDVEKECDCNSKKQAKIDSALCLTNSRSTKFPDSLFYPDSCQYDLAPEGAHCALGMLCDSVGRCSKGMQCVRDTDCYNKGRKFCFGNAEIINNGGVLTQFSCGVDGFCSISRDFCAPDEECKKTWKGALCIKRPSSLIEVS